MSNRAVPVAGEFYRHFKGNLYQIIGIAKHSETLEPMVVYQALYGDYGLYTRPLDMFLSTVDKAKYPQAEQEYRFERVQPGQNADIQKNTTDNEKTVEVKIETTAEDKDDKETVREEILRFLDAEGAEEKLKVLRELRMNLDNELLTTIELSMDLLPDDNQSMEQRFDLIERTLEKRIRFEGGRLR